MTGKHYWYNSLERPLEEKAIAEARIIVEAFHEREIPIEIGGFRDEAEEDDDLHAGGIAFMCAKRQILIREQYLDGAGGTLEPREPGEPRELREPSEPPEPPDRLRWNRLSMNCLTN